MKGIPLAYRLSVLLNLLSLLGFGALLVAGTLTPGSEVVDLSYRDNYYATASTEFGFLMGLPLLVLALGIALQIATLRRLRTSLRQNGEAR